MYTKSLGNREWGISPSGERIYHISYCKCRAKVFMCESEFAKLLEDVGWQITKCSIWEFLAKKYGLRFPKIKIEWKENGINNGVDFKQGY